MKRLIDKIKNVSSVDVIAPMAIVVYSVIIAASFAYIAHRISLSFENSYKSEIERSYQSFR